MGMRQKHIIRFLALVGVLILLNVIFSNTTRQLDFTEDKRYTLSENSKNVLDQVEEPIEIIILLAEDVPANLKRLQKETEDLITRMNRVNFKFELYYQDPLDGTVEETNENKRQLAEVGIYPMELSTGDQEGYASKLIYPYAVIRNKYQQFAIGLLEEASVEFDPEEQLNQSIELLEFKFVNALKRFVNPERGTIAFTEGHGEWTTLRTGDLERNLEPFYNIVRFNPDSIIAIPQEVDVVIIGNPNRPWSNEARFQLDQYVMRGGNVIFALDNMDVSLDSIGKHGKYIPLEQRHGLDDLLFKYGVRLNYNLVQDLECTRIPMGTGRSGGQGQMQRFPWYYHVLAKSKQGHPVTKGLDRVNMFFPSTIDTIRTSTDIHKTVLIESSQYSRVQGMPASLDFSILRYPPETDAFTGGPYALGVLLEGDFESNYTNRPPSEVLAVYNEHEIPFLKSGSAARIAVLSDGDIVASFVRPTDGEPYPLGYNVYEDVQFANKQLLVNLVEYMTDGYGVMGLRNRVIKKRPLDKTKILKEKSTWQLVNLALPLVIFALFGFIFNMIRTRKYTR